MVSVEADTGSFIEEYVEYVHEEVLSVLLDNVLRLDKILSPDGRVLIIDQICLVIPDPANLQMWIEWNGCIA
jgi:hypothetical protein